SATFQNLPGIPIAANNVYTSAQIRPSLGRDLASGASGVVTLTILEPNTSFEDRLNQVDVRLTKAVRFGGKRVQGMLDIYNLFNNDSVLLSQARVGTAFLQPQQVLGGRLFKLGAQFDF